VKPGVNHRAKEDAALSRSTERVSARRKKSDTFRCLGRADRVQGSLSAFPSLALAHASRWFFDTDGHSKLNFQMDSLPRWMAKARAFFRINESSEPISYVSRFFLSGASVIFRAHVRPKDDASIAWDFRYASISKLTIHSVEVSQEDTICRKKYRG